MIVKIKGVLTSCITGKEMEVEVEMTVKEAQHGRVVCLIGGPTGYESFYAKDSNRKPGDPWLACAGTPRRWDRLAISGEEMDRALAELAVQTGKDAP